MAKRHTRLDGWRSALTKLGTAQDKLESYAFIPPTILTFDQCATLYNFNALAARICDIMPEDGMREGVSIKDDDGAEVEQIQTRLTDLQAVELVTQAACYGNAFGRAGVFIGCNDGQTLDKPLDPKRVAKVEFLRVVDRRDLAIREWYGNPLSTKFNMPELFTFVQPTNGGDTQGAPTQELAGVMVHETRFVWFSGARTAHRDARNLNLGWPFSKLQRVHDQLLRVGVSWEAAAQLLQILSQTVIKIKGLQESLASEGGAEALEKRAMAVDLARSITRSLWIDADGEEVTQLTVPLAGLADVLDRQGAYLSALTGIPVSKLFGTQAKGLGQTGDADERSWNNRIESYRRQELQPAIDTIVACLAAEQSVSGDMHVVFPSLDRPTEAEAADIRLKVAQADQIYVANQIVLPAEIAVSRFGGPEWSMETHLDAGPREELEFPAPPGTPSPEEQLALKQASAKGANQDPPKSEA